MRFPKNIPPSVQAFLEAEIEGWSNIRIGEPFLRVWKRLAYDPRMEEVYALLSDEEQIRRFLVAAYSFCRFDVERRRVERAAELVDKIIPMAERLAALVRELNQTGVDPPEELSYSAIQRLDALIDAAKRYKPVSPIQEYAVATASRKRNPKMEYLRALAYVLTEHFHIPLTLPIRKAMAVVAAVVIDDPDMVVTLDDVNKAMAAIDDNSP